MQWKGMDWPILVDPLNLLGLEAVPIYMFVDEHGVVRKLGPKQSELPAFLAQTFEPPATPAASQPAPDPALAAERARAHAGDPRAWMDLGDALFLRQEGDDLDRAAEAYTRAVGLGASPPEAQFRLGVVLRRRYETEARRKGDFQGAVSAWTRALAARPNQYIWRRRIEQYGPRLAKPNSFYDWVFEAQQEITERGEQPVPLRVLPRGAEIAHPTKELEISDEKAAVEPDPDDAIRRDEKPLIAVEATLAPAVVAAGGSARVHLTFRPSPEHDGHWNNEVGPLVVWLAPPAGAIEVTRRRHEVAGPSDAATSVEERGVEVEVRRTEKAGGALELPGYALYYVCDGAAGVCLYRRQNFVVPIALDEE
jgi:hypothetical protein